MKYIPTIVVLLLGQSIPTAQSLLGVKIRSLLTPDGSFQEQEHEDIAESFQKREHEENDQCFDDLSLDDGYVDRYFDLYQCSRSNTYQGSVLRIVQDVSLCDASAIKNFTDYCDANYQSFVRPDYNMTCPIPAPTGYPAFTFTYVKENKNIPGCYSLPCDVDFENETEALAFFVDSVSHDTGSVCTLNDESSVDGPSDPLDSDLQCVIDTETSVGFFSADPAYEEKMKAVLEYSFTYTEQPGPDGITLLEQYDYSMSDADLVDDLKEYCNANYKVGVYPDHRVTCTGILNSRLPPGASITIIVEYKDYFDCFAPSCDPDFENDDEALAFSATYTTGEIAFAMVPRQMTGVCTSELLINGKTSKKNKKDSKKDKKASKKDKKASKKDKKASKNGKKGK